MLSTDSFRFDVAFSFSGSHRNSVRDIATLLRDTLGQERVFFDEWFEHELLGSDMDALLQRIYHQQSLIVVADLSEEYSDRPWCQVEARAIRALRFDIDTARDDTKRLRLLNLRLGSGSVPGVFNTEAYLDAYNKTASECAELILARLKLLRSRMAENFEPLRPAQTSPPDIPFFDDVPLYFQNREPEQAKIRSFLLHPSMRLLRVFGASGNGKTVLVHRVLNELMADGASPRHFKAVIVLNAAQPDGISISSLVSELTEQLKLRLPLHQREGDVANQLLSILSELRRERVVVFIDEFELVVDSTTRGTKPEAAALISLILRQVRSPLKLILTTVFEPNDLALFVPSLQDRIVVNPLDSPHGENLLRQCDADGKVGLRDVSSELLTLACNFLDNSPRELEFLYWYLWTHPSTTLDQVLRNEDILHHNSTEFFVDKTFVWLDSDTQKAAKALAIFGRPIKPEAVSYLLRSSGDETNALARLSQLYDMGFAHRQGQSYYLQPIQRQYVLQQIPALRSWNEHSDLAFSRDLLYARAADYFAEVRKGDQRDAPEDVSTALDEFELRCYAGDYERAGRLLLEVDVAGLIVRGRFGRLVELHEQLRGKLRDPALRMDSLVRLGIAYYRLGNCSSAVNCFQMALAIATGQNVRTEAIIKGNLGNCYAALGRTHHAIRIYSEALEDLASLSDDGSRATVLQCLGNRYADLGDLSAAASHYERAFERYDALLSGRDLGPRGDAAVLAEVMEGRALLLANIASLRIDQRRFSEAIHAASEAYSVGIKLRSALVQIGSKYNLAAANLYIGNLDVARSEIAAAQKLDVPQLNHQVFALLGIIAFRQKDIENSRRVFPRAIEYANSLVALNKLDYGALDFISLSEFGLSLCGVSDRALSAKAAYRSARAINKDSGVVTRFMTLFRALTLDVQYGGTAPFDE
jgi:tetratricopeptide (TPR) repeat protein